MKATAMSVWIFLNLVCFGMCGYIYLIWSQYWMEMEKQKLFNTPPENLQRSRLAGVSIEVPYMTAPKKHSYVSVYNLPTFKNGFVRKRSAVLRNRAKLFEDSSTSYFSNKLNPSKTVIRKEHGVPRFPNVHKPVLEFDSNRYVCRNISTSECRELSAEFKEILLKEFQRVLMDESDVFKSGVDSQNPYGVKYKSSGRLEVSGTEVLCALQRVPVQTVTEDDQPFSKMGFKIPTEPLQQNRLFNTCAIVTSAGALLDSNLGEYIDSHDMVLRFNNAPTKNYTRDVGSKTTFRILNSQVVTKAEFRFLREDLYKNVSILIWDPAKFSSTLEKWYRRPDFPLFPIYKKLLEERPASDVHLLKPNLLWDLWKVLQDFSPYRLRRNPPSSGFIGIWFALHRCKRVRVFEYVPSARATRRCHYYASSSDPACTLGVWHPLAQEKRLAERMRQNSDVEVFQRGYIDIPGFINLNCQ